MVALLGAKAKAMERIKKEHPEWDDYTIVSKLVGYSSSKSGSCSPLYRTCLTKIIPDQAHSSVERAGLLGGVKLRSIKADESLQMKGEALEAAIKEDIAAGLIPFYVVATLGTTNTCAFDRLDEVGPVANRYGVWLHVDAAYVNLFDISVVPGT